MAANACKCWASLWHLGSPVPFLCQPVKLSYLFRTRYILRGNRCHSNHAPAPLTIVVSQFARVSPGSCTLFCQVQLADATADIFYSYKKHNANLSPEDFCRFMELTNPGTSWQKPVLHRQRELHWQKNFLVGTSHTTISHTFCIRDGHISYLKSVVGEVCILESQNCETSIQLNSAKISKVDWGALPIYCKNVKINSWSRAAVSISWQDCFEKDLPRERIVIVQSVRLLLEMLVAA